METRKMAILNLTQCLKNNNKFRKTDVIIKFRINAYNSAAKQRYCTRILTRKINNFRNAYYQIKHLPYQQARKHKSKATLFEEKITKFMFINRLKEVHTVFKLNGIEGHNKK